MEYISSDTNFWIDFSVIGRIDLPFRLPFTYIMNADAIEDELLSPAGLRDALLSGGLVPVELTIEEFFLAEQFEARYRRLHRYDRIALAIAKCREIILLTGDWALRQAAENESVRVMGTIGILDRLLDEKRIDREEYIHCLKGLAEHNGREVRLPKDQLEKRIRETKE